MRTPRLCCLLALPLLTTLLGACTNAGNTADGSAFLPESQRVSTVPWNKPSDWEGQNALGALSNDPRFSGQR